MSGTPEARNLEHDVNDHQVTSGNSSVYSEAVYEVVEDEDTFVEAPWRQENKLVRLSLSWKFGDIDFSKMHVSLSRRETDGLGWNEKRHGVHSNRDTAALCLGRPRRP